MPRQPAARSRIASRAVPVPEGEARGIVGLTDARRFDVPTLLICPEFSVDQAKAWVDGGDVSELATAKALTYVDIDTGHWPMVSAPAALAGIISDAAGSA